MMDPANFALYVFSIVFISAGIVGYLFFARGYLIDNKLIGVFGAGNCSLNELNDALLSRCMKNDGGDVTLVVHLKNNRKIYSYSVGLTGKLSKLRYLVYAQPIDSNKVGIFGSEYIYRVAKSKGLYTNSQNSINAVPAGSVHLPSYMEAAEVCEGYVYVYYRLPMIFGFEPLDLLVKALESRGVNS